MGQTTAPVYWLEAFAPMIGEMIAKPGNSAAFVATASLDAFTPRLRSARDASTGVGIDNRAARDVKVVSQAPERGRLELIAGRQPFGARSETVHFADGRGGEVGQGADIHDATLAKLPEVERAPVPRAPAGEQHLNPHRIGGWDLRAEHPKLRNVGRIGAVGGPELLLSHDQIAEPGFQQGVRARGDGAADGGRSLDEHQESEAQ